MPSPKWRECWRSWAKSENTTETTGVSYSTGFANRNIAHSTIPGKSW